MNKFTLLLLIFFFTSAIMAKSKPLAKITGTYECADLQELNLKIKLVETDMGGISGIAFSVKGVGDDSDGPVNATGITTLYRKANGEVQFLRLAELGVFTYPDLQFFYTFDSPLDDIIHSSNEDELEDAAECVKGGN